MAGSEQYDPDEHERAVNAITPERFGSLIARSILDNPRSQYWILVHQVIESETGWQVEHEELEPFLKKIAGLDTESDH